jgi:hypothetical protein
VLGSWLPSKKTNFIEVYYEEDEEAPQGGTAMAALASDDEVSWRVLNGEGSEESEEANEEDEEHPYRRRRPRLPGSHVIEEEEEEDVASLPPSDTGDATGSQTTGEAVGETSATTHGATVGATSDATSGVSELAKVGTRVVVDDDPGVVFRLTRTHVAVVYDDKTWEAIDFSRCISQSTESNSDLSVAACACAMHPITLPIPMQLNRWHVQREHRQRSGIKRWQGH